MRRYSIRALLITTAVVALLLAGPVRQSARQKRGVQWVQLQRGHLTYRHHYDQNARWYSVGEGWAAGSGLPVPKFLVDLFGVDAFNPVTAVIFDCDEVQRLEPLLDFRSLETLVINIEIAKDLDFEPLKELPRLKDIHFTQWAFITDDQLADVRRLLPDAKIHLE